MRMIAITKDMIKRSPESRVREDTVTISNFRGVSCKFPLADRLSSPRSS